MPKGKGYPKKKDKMKRAPSKTMKKPMKMKKRKMKK